ncbi:farnesyl cysteine-carboxyl methyltransferase [Exserohilum turcicum]
MPSNHPSAPARSTNNKLYQACLEACIDGIESFPVDKRSSTALPHRSPSTKQNTESAAFTEIASTSLADLCTTSSLPSPPLSPSRTGFCKQLSSILFSPPLAAMERSRYADTPIRSKEPPSQGSLNAPLRGPSSALPSMTSGTSALQNAHNNLATQPVASTGKSKVKKSAVKIVGPVGHVPVAPAKPMAATPPVPSSLIVPPVNIESRVAEGPLVASAVSTPKTTSSQKENVQSTQDPGSLEALFARLTSKSSTIPIRPSISTSGSGPEKSKISLESQWDAPKVDRPDATEPTKVTAHHATLGESASTKFSQSGKQSLPDRPVELENEYMRKASAYIDALPDTKLGTARLIGVVSKKLHGAYARDMKMQQESVEAIKARFAFAIVTYLNKVLAKGPKKCTTDFIKQILHDVQGDFLKLCAKLVEEKYVSLEKLDDVAGLAKVMLDIFPKRELGHDTVTGGMPKTEPPNYPTIQEKTAESKVASDSAGSWPSQDKRETFAAHRTCILKGVTAVTSINQLQALVWGGRLESISGPESGSSNALVKFLTADACERYHRDTANGITIKADMKNAVVFVELTEGPNSTNDVIQRCIEGGVSRCVRAIGKVECNDTQLMALAQGKDQAKKREVDRIKRGKNVRGHEYVEFRFANIYNALSFRRELMDDDDWEHCNIGYAPDPCEVAAGLHYED